MSHCSVYTCDCSAADSHTVYSCTTCEDRSPSKKKSGLPPLPKTSHKRRPGSIPVSRRSSSSFGVAAAFAGSSSLPEGQGTTLTSDSLAEMMREVNSHARREKRMEQRERAQMEIKKKLHAGGGGKRSSSATPRSDLDGAKPLEFRSAGRSPATVSVAASSMTCTSVASASNSQRGDGGIPKMDAAMLSESGSRASAISTSVGSTSVSRLEALKAFRAELERERQAKKQLQEQVRSLSNMQDRLEGMLCVRDIGKSASPLRRRSLALEGKQEDTAPAGGGLGRQTPVMRVTPDQLMVPDENPNITTNGSALARTNLGSFKVLSPTTY